MIKTTTTQLCRMASNTEARAVHFALQGGTPRGGSVNSAQCVRRSVIAAIAELPASRELSLGFLERALEYTETALAIYRAHGADC